MPRSRLVLARVLLALGLLPATGSSATKPNILFILIDDLGWNDVGYNGSTFHETPHLDRLAGEWMRFDRCYTSSPMCSPTRVSIMTGKDPARHGVTQWLPGRQVRNERVLCPPPTQRIQEEETTLAEALGEAGYATAFFGKWHMGSLKETGGPRKHGFDEETAVIETNRCAMFYPFRGPKYFDNAKEGDNFTDKLTDAAVEFIERDREVPFFAYLSHFAMHAPIASKPDWRERFSRKASALPPLTKEQAAVEDEYSSRPYKARQDDPDYAGELATLDANIGRVVESLRRSGQYENTIIILTGDNGGRTALGFHGHPTSVQPLRAGKTFLFEGGLRTPLLIHWPGHTKAGSQTDVPVTSTDFYPTLLEMVGLPATPDQHIDGTSLVPLLSGQPLRPRTLAWHFPHYQGEGASPASAILEGSLKLIVNYHFNDHLLFDLATDPNETRNLAAERPEAVSALKGQLMEYLKETGARIPQPNPAGEGAP